MTDTRNPRGNETRENTAQPSDAWLPSSSLPTPDPRDGWEFRWIRTSSLGKADNSNVSRKLREGWVPVNIEEHPELKVMSDINSQFKGNIEIGGLLLCKAPAERMAQRRAYHEKLARSQMESVDNTFMRENDPRMPLLTPSRESKTTFGRG